jgi:hypothetical protein
MQARGAYYHMVQRQMESDAHGGHDEPSAAGVMFDG